MTNWITEAREAHQDNKPRRVSDEEVLAWAKRHDLHCWDNIAAARPAFDDAQTLHLTAGVTVGDHHTNARHTPMEGKPSP